MANGILQMPCFVYINKLWEDYKRQQDDLTKKKMHFLEQQAFNNFYEQFLILHKNRIGHNIDLPAYFYAKKDAEAKAREVVLQVAANGRINQCYKARIDELKKNKI